MRLEEKLTVLRKEKGLTQSDMAEAVMVSRQAVSKWETGRALPSAENLKYLSELFGVSIDYLLNDESREEPEQKKIAEESVPEPQREETIVPKEESEPKTAEESAPEPRREETIVPKEESEPKTAEESAPEPQAEKPAVPEKEEGKTLSWKYITAALVLVALLLGVCIGMFIGSRRSDEHISIRDIVGEEVDIDSDSSFTLNDLGE